ncbi:MAG TPA: cytosine permease, partial [Puia sp.]
FIRRQQLSLPDLYQARGAYTYVRGFNRSALLSLALGILPNIPGFLVTVGAVGPGVFPVWLVSVYSYAWFTGFFVAGGSYCLLMRAARMKTSTHHYKEEVNYDVSVD